MINDKFEKTLDFIDLDPKFLISILKKYIIHIIAFISIITLLVLLFTLNQDKKYKSQAKIVIEPDNNIVNIQEYSSVMSENRNRINNQIAMFKSDQVLEYIIKDKENSKKFQNYFLEERSKLYSKNF
jgi:uncharacterized protein involved in exopolysaccharide biosynthesis